MKSILIIDDATFQADILKTVLNNTFSTYLIETVKSVSESNVLLLENEYDLILIDFMLGDSYNAVDLKSELGHLQVSPTTWVVLSALDPVLLKEQYPSEGFSDFIHKTDYLKLIEKLKEYLCPELS